MNPLVTACAILAMATPALSQDLSGGMAADGEAVFKRCSGCHAIGEGAKHKVGPHLNDLIGRVAGSLPDYRYSEAMVRAGEAGLAWTGETLWTFLANPREAVPGNKMTFAGIKDPAQLADLIAYLSIGSTER